MGGGDSACALQIGNSAGDSQEAVVGAGSIVRADVEGNLWCSSNAGRSVGYSGVTVWNPDGKLIGRIRLPEICGNVCFGGPKRNRLFMAGSQSLYAVYTATQGAAPG